MSARIKIERQRPFCRRSQALVEKELAGAERHRPHPKHPAACRDGDDRPDLPRDHVLADQEEQREAQVDPHAPFQPFDVLRLVGDPQEGARGKQENHQSAQLCRQRDLRGKIEPRKLPDQERQHCHHRESDQRRDNPRRVQPDLALLHQHVHPPDADHDHQDEHAQADGRLGARADFVLDQEAGDQQRHQSCFGPVQDHQDEDNNQQSQDHQRGGARAKVSRADQHRHNDRPAHPDRRFVAKQPLR